jgi:ribosome-associated protein
MSSVDPLDLKLPGGRRVPAAAVGFRATTSGGPGGQHANRTASRVEVFISIEDLPLEPRERARIYERCASRITGAGELAAASGEHRQQHRNRELATRRLEQLIADALRERRRRIPTRASRGAQLRQRETKQHNSARKRSRRWRWPRSEEE